MNDELLKHRRDHGAQQVSEGQRLGTLPDVFGGTVNGLIVEQAVFNVAGQIVDGYRGGYWEFVRLRDGGFYMHLDTEQKYRIRCEGNGYDGEVSGDALGIIVCMFAYSNLSFEATGAFQERLSNLYYSLRGYMQHHPEVQEILGAID
jgi:hypothetical protein